MFLSNIVLDLFRSDKPILNLRILIKNIHDNINLSQIDDDAFKLYFLREYHLHGLPARIALVNFFLDQLNKDIKKYTKFQPNPNLKFNLNNNQKFSLLQIATISHIMMLIEDVAVLFTAFKENNLDYYRYLDKKDEEDLGKIIGEFYNNIDKISDQEVGRILGYLDPKNLDVSESERDFLRGMMKKNVKTMRYFLLKSSMFWKFHIKIFRRYKHAGFPIILGESIPKNDELLNRNFDFMSYAPTEPEKLDEKISLIPFSKEVLKSYEVFRDDLAAMLLSCIEGNLQKIINKEKGRMPNPNDFLSKRLTKNEKKKLEKIYKKFIEENADEVKVQGSADLAAEYPGWYIHLGQYSKPAIDVAIENEK